MASPTTAIDVHTLGSLWMPRGMVWVDEFRWSAVAKSLDYSVTGSALIDAGVKLAGRPITLQGVDDAGWIDRAALFALQQLADDEPLGVHRLTLADGRSFDVQFADGEPAVTGEPVARPELPPDDHPYVATVRLITV